MKSKKRAGRVHPDLALARRVSYNAVCLLGVRVSKGLRASRGGKRQGRILNRKKQQAFDRLPEKTYSHAELAQRAERRVHAVRAGNHNGGRARSTGKHAARDLVCLEHGIEYSPRKFRKLLKRLNRGEVAA